MAVLTYISITLGVFLAVVLVWIITCQVREHHLQNDPMLERLKEVLEPVHPIIKSLKLYRGDKSYTINKERVFLCLKDENGDYYSFNTLVYVLLHEIAHVLNKESIGHDELFQNQFDELLEKAMEFGLFNPSIPIIKNYCGHD